MAQHRAQSPGQPSECYRTDKAGQPARGRHPEEGLSSSNKMSTDKRDIVMGWVQAALGRVREFAYAERPAEARPAVRPKLGLALGGGFARGIAHAGVLHTLEQQGIPIDYIAGTSAGALAGIAYASGLPFEEVVK